MYVDTDGFREVAADGHSATDYINSLSYDHKLAIAKKYLADRGLKAWTFTAKQAKCTCDRCQQANLVNECDRITNIFSGFKKGNYGRFKYEHLTAA